jgi:hypothetical protein
MCRLLITAIFAAAMWPVAAYANQTLAAFSPPSSSPVVINACGASLSDTSVGNVNYYVNNAVKFTNTSDKPVVAVRFRFDLLDAFAQPLRTLTGDVTGYFSPGVLIEPHYNITAERFDTNVWSTININPNIAEVRCSVELVRFEDDSTWSPAAQVASGSINQPHLSLDITFATPLSKLAIGRRLSKNAQHLPRTLTTSVRLAH